MRSILALCKFGTVLCFILGFRCPLLVDEINISTVYVRYSIVFWDSGVRGWLMRSILALCMFGTVLCFVLGFQCPLMVDEINISTVYVWYSSVFCFGIPVSIVS